MTGLLRTLTLLICATIAAAEPPKELKIGVVLGLTGYAAVHSQNIQRGLSLAQQELEKEGWKISLTYEDDGSIASRSISSVRSLISRGFRIFIGPTWSFQVAAVSPVYRTTDTVAYGPAVFADVAGGPNPNVFFGVPPARMKVAPLVDWLRQKGFKRAAILYATSDWGEVHRAVFASAASSAGVEIVATEQFSYGSEVSSIPPVVDRLRLLHPDVLLTTSSADGTSQIVRRLTQTGFTTAFLSTDDAYDAVVQKLIDPSKVSTKLYSLRLRSSPSFDARYRAAYHELPGVYSDTAYDGLKMIAAAHQSSDGSPSGIRAVLRSHSFEGVRGTLRFDEKGEMTLGDFVVDALNP